jgi:acyl-coenzyme A thioesterase PaaI-like protein
MNSVATPSVFSLNASQKKRLEDFNSPLKLWFWLFYKLPIAWFMGMGVKKITPEKGEVTLPYGWRSQNPFQSIYFAAQCAAAEFSTGALATLAIAGRGRVSMLVTNLEADFLKKANTKTLFTCEDGQKVFEIVEKAIQTGEPQVITMVSKGVQESGETVSVVRVTWSFRAKKG